MTTPKKSFEVLYVDAAGEDNKAVVTRFDEETKQAALFVMGYCVHYSLPLIDYGNKKEDGTYPVNTWHYLDDWN